MSAQENQDKVARAESSGLWVGIFVGAFIGVLIGGPQFREWDHPISSWLLIILASSTVGAAIGYFFFGVTLRGVMGTPGATGLTGYDVSDGAGGSGGVDGGGGGD